MSRTNASIERPDPLGVRSSTRAVMATATSVRVDTARITDVARDLATMSTAAPTWAHPLHWRGDAARTATWVFVLDALNFCFWGHDTDPDHRWRVTWQGETHDGYWALAAALSRGVADGIPLHDPAWLAQIDDAAVTHLLRPATAETPPIPRFADRVANLRELGNGLLAIGGGEEAALRLVALAGGSAVRLVQEVVARFPSFADEATLDGETVRFYKRAQILVADLAGAFTESAPGLVTDLDQLTAFADYKVPQVLRRFGLLVYTPDLAARIARRERLPAGSREEIEIRAATVQAVELLREASDAYGREFSASDIDWLLWMAGQSLPTVAEPYHRTSTVFY
jgi:hypothetical protein